MYKNLAAAFAAACFSLLSFSATTSANAQSATSTKTPPLKIGFVYVAPIGDAGWVRQHEEGRKAVEAMLRRVASASTSCALSVGGAGLDCAGGG